MSILIQILTGTKNFRILPDFQISSLANWSKISFSSHIFKTTQNFCCQISSFAGPEWSQVTILSQMFDATENFWILPNFILRMSPVVKNDCFELNFWHESKCWLCKMSSFAGQEWSNSLFQAKFSKRLKISGFCQISSFAGLEWSKIYFLSQIFNTNQHFSRFCQISSFAGSEWSTLSFFSQICSVTENFWILPNFIHCMSRVVKTLNFVLDFDCDWKFLNFTTFHPLHVQSGQKCQLWAKFLTRIKISWFCKISSFTGQEWSKSWLQAEFSMRLKISGFCQISSFTGLEWSKISFLSQIFNTNQNFPRFCQISSFLVF